MTSNAVTRTAATRIAVIGTGAVGATIAAWLIDNPAHDVTLCVRTSFDRLRVQTPDRLLQSAPTQHADPADVMQADWVFVATKTYDTPGAARWLERLAGPHTRVAVLQNGVEHRARFPTLDAAQIVPVIVDIPAERHAPGDVVQRRAGSMVVPVEPHGAAFAALFANSPIDVQCTDDWLSAAWRKLAINCAGAVNALTLRPAEVANDPDAAALMHALVGECIAVGRAEGALLDDALADRVIAGYRADPPDSMNSILADRLAGRSTEADARNGVIARLGARHDIATPYNNMADRIVRLSEANGQLGQGAA